MAGKTKELFAANLRALLDDKVRNPPQGETRADWSQAAFARRIGVDGGTVSRWLKGDVLPHADQLDALADLFKIPVMRFFADPSDHRPPMTPEKALEVLTEIVRARATDSSS